MMPSGVEARRLSLWVALLLDLGGLLLSGVRFWTAPTSYPVAFVAAFLLAWCVCACAAVVLLVRGHLTVIAVRGFGVVSVMSLLGHLPGIAHTYDREAVGAGYPPLFHAIAVGVVGLMLTMPWREAIVLGLGYGPIVGIARAPAVGPAQAVAEAVVFSNTALIAAWALRLVRRVIGGIERRAADLQEVTDAEVRSQQRAFEQERWNGLVHDKVLGALRLVFRETSEVIPAEARRLAADAKAAVDQLGAEGNPASLQERIVQLCRRQGLRATIELEGEVTEPTVRATLTDAVAAAVTNVALHAESGVVMVIGTLTATGADIEVRDAGRGFDRAGVPEDRLGISQGIELRMRSIGGEAEVRSVPGQGTTVWLRWRVAECLEPTLRWREDAFLPMVAFGVVAMLGHVGVGLTYLAQFTHPRAVVGGMAILLVGQLALAFVPLRPAAVYGGLALLVLSIPAALSVLLILPSSDDWRFWYLGAIDAATAVLSFRVRPLAGVVATLVAASAVLAVHVLQDDLRLFNVASGFFVPMASALGGGAVRIMMDQTTARVAEFERQRSSMMARQIVAQERAIAAQDRVSRLGRMTLPVLDAVSTGTVLTDEFRAECRELEAVLRDQLLAGELIDRALADAIFAARRRGVTVEVGCEGALGPGAVDLRTVANHVLGQAGAGDSVQLRWFTSRSGSQGFVTFVGRWQNCAVLADIDTWRQQGVQVEVSTDPDSVLYEFPAQLHPARG